MGFVLLRGGILAERFLYAPALGLSIVIVWQLAQLSKLNFQSAEVNFSALLKNKLFSGYVGKRAARGIERQRAGTLL